MPTRYLRLGPREQDTGSDDTSRRTEQDEEEFWPKLDKKTADRIGILNRWIYPVCRSVVTGYQRKTTTHRQLFGISVLEARIWRKIEEVFKSLASP